MNFSDHFQEGKPACASDIEQLENMAGGALPNEFRSFLEQSNGHLKLECFCGPHQLIYVQNLYTLTTEDDYCDLRYEYRTFQHSELTEEPYLPIMYANGGDYVLLGMNTGKLIMLNHEDDSIELVTCSFFEFLNYLQDDFPEEN